MLASRAQLWEHDQTMMSNLYPELLRLGISFDELWRQDEFAIDLRLYTPRGPLLCDWKYHAKPTHRGIHMLNPTTATKYDALEEPLLIVSFHGFAEYWHRLREIAGGIIPTSWEGGREVAHVWKGGRTWEEVLV